MTAIVASQAGKTRRFYEKRERILDAATVLINQYGVKGMTFVDVARLVDLNTTSITYYFKKKELLAAEVLSNSLERLSAIVDNAREAPTPNERVAKLLRSSIELHARIRLNEERPVAILSDIRALDDPFRTELNRRYLSIFNELREFFGPVRGEEDAALRTARTHVLVENVFWLQAWLRRYSLGDYERVGRRLFEVFDKGIAKDGAPWAPATLEMPDDDSRTEIDGMPGNFMRAATCLINKLGYRGASVERIASENSVTKGSFYHHLKTKDDLVIECFRWSYGRVSRVQRAAINSNGDYWTVLATAIATLLDIQFYSDFPLLRTTALQVLPTELRTDILERSNRMARRFAGAMIDGITEGSVRAIDPLIASQAVMAGLNGAYELRKWASAHAPKRAIELYGSTLAYGLFRDGIVKHS
ncbi:MAG TPA: TetR/AcrR family transcriptional regulator [Parvularculaceae bacterium]|nr:TetR/AcrR family transcriptional regulator [Parvularculaceae bacterium]